MPQEYKDYVSANGGIEGQVTPTVYVTAGALTTVSSPAYIGTTFTSALATAAGPFFAASYSFSTHDNSQPNQYLSNYAWLTTVAGPTYNSPGGILNKVTPNGTGGGP
jgi:hypothetical protein